MDFVLYNKNTRNKLNIFTNLFDNSNISIGYSVNTEKFESVFGSTILSWNGKILHEQGITTTRETVNGSNANVRFRTFAMAAYGPVFQYDKNVNFPISSINNPIGCDDYLYNGSSRKIPKTYVTGDFNGDGLTDV